MDYLILNSCLANVAKHFWGTRLKGLHKTNECQKKGTSAKGGRKKKKETTGIELAEGKTKQV